MSDSTTEKPEDKAAEGIVVAANPHDAESSSEAKPAEKKPIQPPQTGRSLRRLLDAEIDDEVEAALAQFDGAKILAEPTKGSQPIAAEPAKRNEKKAYKVLSVRGEDVFVDMGERSEGVVAAIQFDGKLPSVGDLVELVIDHQDPETELFILRRPGTAQEADWGSVAKGMIVDAHVKKLNKGGLEVAVNGIRAFMPAGQVDIDHIADLSVFVGQVLRCEITEVSLSAKNLIVSRKIILERERAEKARATRASLAEGQEREGVVRRLTDFGAFVDLGGVDGLIHVSQMSWQRVNNPADILSVGQEVRVVVLKIDEQTGKIGLGLKQLTDSPWKGIADRYPAGRVVPGIVTKIMEFGAFVELEPGVEGMVHISEMAKHRVMRISNVVKVGQAVEVKVLEVDPDKKRISLSLKQAQPEPVVEAKPQEEAEPEPIEPVKKKGPQKPLKGGLGGPTGNLFG